MLADFEDLVGVVRADDQAERAADDGCSSEASSVGKIWLDGKKSRCWSLSTALAFEIAILPSRTSGVVRSTASASADCCSTGPAKELKS